MQARIRLISVAVGPELSDFGAASERQFGKFRAHFGQLQPTMPEIGQCLPNLAEVQSSSLGAGSTSDPSAHRTKIQVLGGLG